MRYVLTSQQDENTPFSRLRCGASAARFGDFSRYARLLTDLPGKTCITLVLQAMCHSNSHFARRSFLCISRWEFARPSLSPFEGIPLVLQICCLSSRSGICCSTTPLLPTKLVRQSVTLLLHRPQRQPQVGSLQLQDLGSRCLKDLAVTLDRSDILAAVCIANAKNRCVLKCQRASHHEHARTPLLTFVTAFPPYTRILPSKTMVCLQPPMEAPQPAQLLSPHQQLPLLHTQCAPQMRQ